ncbi:MAG: cysteine desulfurase family protein [Nitritalea sp.]
MLYLDYNATTPLDEEVLDGMLPYFRTHFANPASALHGAGWLAADAVEEARMRLALASGLEADGFSFHGSATEALNVMLLGFDAAHARQKRHYLVNPTEHKAVLACVEQLKLNGADITYIPVDKEGKLHLNQVQDCILPHTRALICMAANNETGWIYPLETLAELARERGLALLTDAAQSFGKIELNYGQLSACVFSAHKFYGPKGVGALYLAEELRPLYKSFRLLHGGNSAPIYGAGTAAVPLLVGMGLAAWKARSYPERYAAHIRPLRLELEAGIRKHFPAAHIHSHREGLPHVCHGSFPGYAVADFFQRTGHILALSSGAACSSGQRLRPSHVLLAVGQSEEAATKGIRFSLGLETQSADITHCLALLADHLRPLTARMEA